MVEDVYKATSDLTRAMQALQDTSYGEGKAFGEVSKESQVWTTISRFLSGTGLWRLQNRIRAVGQTLNIFNEAQAKGLEQQIKAIDANLKFKESFDEIKKAVTKTDKEVRDTPLFKAMFEGEIAGGASAKSAGKKALENYRKTYGDVNKKMEKQRTQMFQKSNAMSYIFGTQKKGREDNFMTRKLDNLRLEKMSLLKVIS